MPALWQNYPVQAVQFWPLGDAHRPVRRISSGEQNRPPKLIIFQDNYLDLTIRTRRHFLRLRFGGNNCLRSVDCLSRAVHKTKTLDARESRSHSVITGILTVSAVPTIFERTHRCISEPRYREAGQI
jgi:hypothetical protein